MGTHGVTLCQYKTCGYSVVYECQVFSVVCFLHDTRKAGRMYPDVVTKQASQYRTCACRNFPSPCIHWAADFSTIQADILLWMAIVYQHL